MASLRACAVVAALPKTRSGKILRRTIRAILEGDPEPPVPPTIDNADVLAFVHAARADIGDLVARPTDKRP